MKNLCIEFIGMQIAAKQASSRFIYISQSVREWEDFDLVDIRTYCLNIWVVWVWVWSFLSTYTYIFWVWLGYPPWTSSFWPRKRKEIFMGGNQLIQRNLALKMPRQKKERDVSWEFLISGPPHGRYFLRFCNFIRDLFECQHVIMPLPLSCLLLNTDHVGSRALMSLIIS